MTLIKGSRFIKYLCFDNPYAACLSFSFAPFPPHFPFFSRGFSRKIPVITFHKTCFELFGLVICYTTGSGSLIAKLCQGNVILGSGPDNLHGDHGTIGQILCLTGGTRFVTEVPWNLSKSTWVEPHKSLGVIIRVRSSVTILIIQEYFHLAT